MSATTTHRHKVFVTVQAWMNDRGEVRIDKQWLDTDLNALDTDPPHTWAKDEDKYLLPTPFLTEPVETTVGVARELIKKRGKS